MTLGRTSETLDNATIRKPRYIPKKGFPPRLSLLIHEGFVCEYPAAPNVTVSGASITLFALGRSQLSTG